MSQALVSIPSHAFDRMPIEHAHATQTHSYQRTNSGQLL